MKRLAACAGLALVCLADAAHADIVADALPHARACFASYDLVASHETYGSIPARMQPAEAQFASLALSPAPLDWQQAPVRFYVIASCEPGYVQFAVTSVIDGKSRSHYLTLDDDGKASWAEGPVRFSISTVAP
jgi:hypothetical protein